MLPYVLMGTRSVDQAWRVAQLFRLSRKAPYAHYTRIIKQRQAFCTEPEMLPIYATTDTERFLQILFRGDFPQHTCQRWPKSTVLLRHVVLDRDSVCKLPEV